MSLERVNTSGRVHEHWGLQTSWINCTVFTHKIEAEVYSLFQIMGSHIRNSLLITTQQKFCIWGLGVGKGGGRLWVRWWTFGFHKMWGISWLAAKPVSFSRGNLLHGVSMDLKLWTLMAVRHKSTPMRFVTSVYSTRTAFSLFTGNNSRTNNEFYIKLKIVDVI